MSLLEQARALEQQVIERLRELEPLTREYEQLRKLAERLGLKYSPRSTRAEEEAQAAATVRAGRTRARASAQAVRATRSRGGRPARERSEAAPGPRRSHARRAPTVRPGHRNDDVLRLVDQQPGITVRELGERLGVDPTGLYRVVKRLADEGRVRRDGPRLHAVESAPAPEASVDGAPRPLASDVSEEPEASEATVS